VTNYLLQQKLILNFKDWLDDAMPREGVTEEVHDQMLFWMKSVDDVALSEVRAQCPIYGGLHRG